MNNDDSVMFNIFNEQCNSNNGKCWAMRVKSLLDDLGFGNV